MVSVRALPAIAALGIDIIILAILFIFSKLQKIRINSTI